MSESRIILVAGRRVHYRTTGAGADVVLVAGLGLSGRFYDRNLPALAAAGLRVTVPDLPGFGGTPGPATGVSVEQTTEFLAAFAAALGIRRAAWIGHSIGWQPAALLAARRPALVAALIAAAPTLPRRRRRALRQLATFTVVAARESFDVVRAVARDYVRTSPLRYFGSWLRHAHDSPLEYLGAVRCPLLVAMGTRDPMASATDLRLILETAPDACIAWIAGGSHGLPRDQADAFNRVVIEFLQRHGGRAIG